MTTDPWDELRHSTMERKVYLMKRQYTYGSLHFEINAKRWEWIEEHRTVGYLYTPEIYTTKHKVVSWDGLRSTRQLRQKGEPQ